MSFVSRGLMISELNVPNTQTQGKIINTDHIKPSQSGLPARNTTTQRYEKMIVTETGAQKQSGFRPVNTQTHEKISVRPLDKS